MAISLNGGKGNKAPHEITHIRVPVPLKYHLEQLVLSYKYVVMSQNQGDINNLLARLIEFVDCLPPNCDQLKLDFKLQQKAETAISELAVKSSSKMIAALEQERDVLRENSRSAIALLEGALKLKPNNGSAIKREIGKALLLIDSQDS